MARAGAARYSRAIALTSLGLLVAALAVVAIGDDRARTSASGRPTTAAAATTSGSTAPQRASPAALPLVLGVIVAGAWSVTAAAARGRG